MYKYFLCLRYLRKRRIAFFAVAAVCLCVAMVLIVISVMDGFLQMVKDRSRGMLGDLVMENGALQGFPFYQEFIDQIKAEMPGEIYEATPVIISYGVIRFPEKEDQSTHAAQIVGLRLDETCRVNDFKKGLFYEKYYPGTTNFNKQKEPRWGLDEGRRYILPAELESAWRKWYGRASPQEREEAPIEEILPYNRPGYYRYLSRPGEDGPELASLAPGWFGSELPGVIIGTDICAERQKDGSYLRRYHRGYRIQLTFVPFSPGGIMSGTGPTSGAFRYVDDMRTGVYDIDSMSVYVDFDHLQDVLEMNRKEYTDADTGQKSVRNARATQIQIKLKPGVDPESARDKISEKWDALCDARIHEARVPGLMRRVVVQTWEEKQARFIAAVEKEKYLVTILFGVISVVAVFLVGCIFYMIVQQKTRDIGIVKSVGATSLGVANIFLTYGAAVGVVGGALGTVIGTLFVWYINEFQDFLAWIHPSAQIWSPEVYAFDFIPNQVDVFHVVVIYSIAIIASMLGSLCAAFRASRVWPVEALRYE